MLVVVGGRLTSNGPYIHPAPFSWQKYSEPMEYLHREIAYWRSWQGSRLTQSSRQGSPPSVGLSPAPSYAVARTSRLQAQQLGLSKAGLQRLVCATNEA